MHDVTEGGVLTAAYEMAVAAGIGIRVDADRVPVLPATGAICDVLGIDPLFLIGSGSLFVATPDAQRTGTAIAEAGVQVTEIGSFLKEGRLVRRAGRDSPLLPA